MIRFFMILLGAGLLIGGTVMFISSSPKEELRQMDAAKRTAILVPLAEKGDIAALVELAGYYRSGRGIKADPVKAFQLYQRAEEQGDNNARYALGQMFEAGEGVRADAATAAGYYAAAARLGQIADAEYSLGTLYLTGRGVRRDASEAMAWFLKAARQGHAAAQCQLANLYVAGLLGKPDLIEAYAWYTLAIPNAAAAKAVKPDLDPVGARDALVKSMDQFQIGLAMRRAEALLKGR